ncbi:TcpQ domain-containing protein [Burkholderia gladioli]|uniref:TcpQ domain-containing protein n=1 Tax=Burkholderia gladioli TaxID=28095 RepID=UPI00130D767A|nr:TcpQ domain-containing protein [Burkholderia gladioli]
MIANFDIRLADLTLANTIARWALESGATIRWSSSVTVPVTANSQLRGTVADAMHSVAQALDAGGYPLVVAEAPAHHFWIIVDAPIVKSVYGETDIVANLGLTSNANAAQDMSEKRGTDETVSGASNWRLLLADRDIRQALARWGEASGNPVRWDSAIVAPITADSTLTGTFDTAIKSVVRALQEAGYPLAVSGPDPTTRTYRVFQTTSHTALAEVFP